MQTVQEIMTKDPVCCSPDASLREVSELMRDNDCGEIPVTEQGKPIGVVTDRDIVCRTIAEGKDAAKATARECMSSPVDTIKPETTVDEAVQRLEEKQIRRGLVVDDTGRLVGIVAQADLALKAGPEKAGELVQRVSAHA